MPLPRDPTRATMTFTLSQMRALLDILPTPTRETLFNLWPHEGTPDERELAKANRKAYENAFAMIDQGHRAAARNLARRPSSARA